MPGEIILIEAEELPFEGLNCIRWEREPGSS